MLSKHQAVCWAGLLFLILRRSPFSRKWLNGWRNGKHTVMRRVLQQRKAKGAERWYGRNKSRAEGSGREEGVALEQHLQGEDTWVSGSRGWQSLGHGWRAYTLGPDADPWEHSMGSERTRGDYRGAGRGLSVLFWNTELHSMYSWKLLGDGCNWRDLLGCYCYKTWEAMKA